MAIQCLKYAIRYADELVNTASAHHSIPRNAINVVKLFVPVLHIINNLTVLPCFDALPSSAPSYQNSALHLWLTLFDRLISFNESSDPVRGGLPLHLAVYYLDHICEKPDEIYECSRVLSTVPERVENADGGPSKIIEIVADIAKSENSILPADGSISMEVDISGHESPLSGARRVEPETAVSIAGLHTVHSLRPLFVHCAVSEIEVWNNFLSAEDRAALANSILAAVGPRVEALLSDTNATLSEIQILSVKIVTFIIALGGNPAAGVSMVPSGKTKYHSSPQYLYNNAVASLINSFAFKSPDNPWLEIKLP